MPVNVTRAHSLYADLANPPDRNHSPLDTQITTSQVLGTIFNVGVLPYRWGQEIANFQRVPPIAFFILSLVTILGNNCKNVY